MKKKVNATTASSTNIDQLNEHSTVNDKNALTTNQVLKINDNQHSLKDSDRGATLLKILF